MSKTAPKALGYFLVAFFSILAHFQWVLQGKYLLHSDYAPILLQADRMAHAQDGGWRAFLMGMDYGGTGWLVPRALFAYGASALTGSLPAHFIFSYLIEPLIVSLMIWGLFEPLVLRHYSPLNKLFAALVVAALPTYFSTQWGNATYIGNLILGISLLQLRLKDQEPWFDRYFLNFKGTLAYQKGLILRAFLVGFSAYNSRMSIIFTLPCVFAIEHFRLAGRLFVKAPKVLRYFWIGLLTLALAVEIFGKNWGRIKIHSEPQLKIVLLGFLVYLCVQFKNSLFSKAKLLALALACFGLTLGLLPEILSYAFLKQGFKGPSVNPVLLKDMTAQFGYLPSTFQEFFGSSLPLAALILLYAGYLFYKRRLKLGPVASLCLGVFLWNGFFILRYQTYTTPQARYFLPSVLFFIFLAVELIKQGKYLGKFLVVSFSVSQFGFFQALNVNQIAAQEVRLNQELSLVEEFKKLNVPFVVSSSYWHTNHLTVFSAQTFGPVFIAQESLGLRDPVTLKRLKSLDRSTTFGYLDIAEKPSLVKTTQIEGRPANLRWISSLPIGNGKIQRFQVYTARFEQ